MSCDWIDLNNLSRLPIGTVCDTPTNCTDQIMSSSMQLRHSPKLKNRFGLPHF
ncbi:hypothetical protein BLL52_4250 [Rhodoferax antarcticus ANT.BR]|uniref:Uncharacterized protein n=1 Tax=Rhodoferax antarcticus ANT.BR TaxID=1111071 RepID=A0A1Q8Y9A2_9BURK|nr:hypothetical protein BLL52_4250 [Rhodoferax antarcticus ANT.BR]